MEILRSKYKMGKFATGGGRFVGKEIEKHKDGSFLLHQKFYTQDKLSSIPLSKERKRQRYSKCNDKEISELRTLLGGLSWVAKETRPDVSGRVAMLQQCMPTPSVLHMIEGNQILEELQKDPTRPESLSDRFPFNISESVFLALPTDLPLKAVI